jgi:YggT family protein
MDHDQPDEIPLERQQELQQEEETFRLRQEEQHLRTIRRNHTYNGLINSIYWLAGMLEILLGLRFFLRVFGANPENEFAQLINNLSAPFIAPFSTLFISPTTNDVANIFDVNIIIAIVVYALLSYLITSLFRLFLYHES